MVNTASTKLGAVLGFLKAFGGGLAVCFLSLLVFALLAVLIDTPVGALVESWGDKWIMIPFEYWWPVVGSIAGVGFGVWLVNKLMYSSNRSIVFVAFSILPILALVSFGILILNGKKYDDITPILNGAASLFAGYFFILRSKSEI